MRIFIDNPIVHFPRGANLLTFTRAFVRGSELSFCVYTDTRTRARGDFRSRNRDGSSPRGIPIPTLWLRRGSYTSISLRTSPPSAFRPSYTTHIPCVSPFSSSFSPTRGCFYFRCTLTSRSLPRAFPSFITHISLSLSPFFAGPKRLFTLLSTRYLSFFSVIYLSRTLQLESRLSWCWKESSEREQPQGQCKFLKTCRREFCSVHAPPGARICATGYFKGPTLTRGARPTPPRLFFESTNYSGRGCFENVRGIQRAGSRTCLCKSRIVCARGSLI